MADYTYESELVADPFTFQRAANSAVTIYDVNDESESTPLALKDLNGLPLPNPLTSSADAFVPPFVTTSPQVKMSGGGLKVAKPSFQGVRDEAVAARNAAQEAQESAALSAELAQAPTDAQVDAGVARANIPAQVSAVVPGLVPSVVSAEVSTPGSDIRSALESAIVAPLLVDGGERMIAMLDQGQTPVRFALAGDSTGDHRSEWFHRGAQSIVDRYPSYAGFLWGEYYYNGSASTGGSAYKRFRLVPIGKTYDEFDSPGELNGKVSTSGQTWASTPGAWTVSAGSATSSSTTNAILTATSPHPGFGRRVSGRLVLDTSLPTAERSITIDIGVDDANRVALKIAISTAGVIYVAVSKVIAGALTSNIAVINPLTSATATGAGVELQFSLEITPTNIFAYVNGNSGGASINAAEFTALGGMTMLRMRATTQAGVKVGRIGLGDVYETPNLIEVWNGSKAGSTLATQQTDMAALYPSQLNCLFISASHNYLDDSDMAYLIKVQTFVDAIRAAHPNTGIVITSQNTEYSPASFGSRAAHNRRNVFIRTFAAQRRYGYVPGTEVFAMQPDGGRSLVDTDGVHPLQTGSDLWGQTFFNWVKGKSLRP
ncbi:SGNH/GDSL hydrolase family protein [Arthrobacter sp. EpRS71]|uniref:SGNH/GDSL hydrolase family protein n=1 Tax=Arthrobacter sp. EpRS71 TaxID=1743141 RepID=UPI00074604A1|nr:SGNH/GDSL hydrolase family protein [Arthrobacter sp. EpRS71]KUM34523.1 hypothetical protein AR689_10290 [Arthrobacter sp. EpRS71]